MSHQKRKERSIRYHIQGREGKRKIVKTKLTTFGKFISVIEIIVEMP
jgi:hypothetical protein